MFLNKLNEIANNQNVEEFKIENFNKISLQKAVCNNGSPPEKVTPPPISI